MMNALSSMKDSINTSQQHPKLSHVTIADLHGDACQLPDAQHHNQMDCQLYTHEYGQPPTLQ